VSVYQIQVQGQIGERWSHWFPDMNITYQPSPDGGFVTTLTGSVPDQAALRGVLSKLWDLNLTLLSVIRCEPKGAGSDE